MTCARFEPSLFNKSLAGCFIWKVPSSCKSIAVIITGIQKSHGDSVQEKELHFKPDTAYK
jgi:hypothetical protein